MADRSNSQYDELYTKLSDIEAELQYYKAHFRDKVVLCNCDDPFESNFFKYFALNFNDLGLKKLITISYDDSPVMGEELPLLPVATTLNKKAYKIELSAVRDINGDGIADLTDVELFLKNNYRARWLLNGSGDFRTYECIGIMSKVDIIVTHPPLSLLDKYIELLINYRKKFIIIGNQSTFDDPLTGSLLQEEKMWLGISRPCGGYDFRMPKKTPNHTAAATDSKNNFVSVNGMCWLTNCKC